MLREVLDRKMTQVKLAKNAKVSQADLAAALERGIRKNPSLPTLKRLVKALGVPVTVLLEQET